MISEQQRRRALARAKWERQQARRTAAQTRNRRLQIIFGAALGVVVVVLAGFGVAHLVSNDGGTSSPSTQLPSDFPTFKTPTNTGFSVSFSPPTTPSSTSPSGPSTAMGSTTSAPTTSGGTGKGSG